MGFTSCAGAATAKPRLDVVVRNAINSGLIQGPRYLAASQEITVPGGLADETLPHLPYPEFSFGAIVSGPEEMRKCVRMFLKYGVDTIKLNLSGEYIAGIAAEFSPMADEEIAMAVSEAKLRHKRVAAHARSCESVKQCVRHGIEIIYHASFADEEALDMLEANKDKHFVAPGIAWLINTSYHAGEFGISPDAAKQMGYHRELEIAIESLKKMRKRGIRILPGGDYGFAWIKHGTNAKDLEYFVKYLGFTPMEALLAATALGDGAGAALHCAFRAGGAARVERSRRNAGACDGAFARNDRGSAPGRSRARHGAQPGTVRPVACATRCSASEYSCAWTEGAQRRHRRHAGHRRCAGAGIDVG